MRTITELKDGWIFCRQAKNMKEALSAEGTAVTLPHTWNAADGQDGGNDYYRGTCWYRRTLEGPAHSDGARVYLEFDGAAMTAEVWMNGEKLARHEGGYSRFRVEITQQIKEGANDLLVSVDNSDNDRVYPQKADFTFYGGLYRTVRLVTVPKEHFSMEYYGGNGIRVTPEVTIPDQDRRSASAVITVEVWAEGGAKEAVITVEGDGAGAAVADGEEAAIAVKDGAGKNTAAAEEEDAAAGCGQAAVSAGTVAAACSDAASAGKHTAAAVQIALADGYGKAVFTFPNVHLWDGVDDPYLYTARAALAGGDAVETRFGCREFHVDPQEGFFLNRRSYPLRGVSRHQDRAGAGNALTPEMHREDMEFVKEIGANTLRLAHYQHAQEFYDLCDENGIVVWAEIPYITLHMQNGRENTLSQMRELVIQNYNHPSIVCWGLSNEITASGGVTEDLLENHRLLNDLCHRLDPTRFTTMADVFMLETDSPLLEIPDVNSYNLYFGWYLGELEQNDAFFDEYHRSYPDRCIGFSEYGADANPQYQSAAPDKGDYTEGYQALYHEHILRMIESRPWIWATHVWNLFDFAADGRDEGGKNGQNQKGLVTMDRKLKKDAFYLYKAYWNKKEPFVHLCGSRYADRTEEVTEIRVYSNEPSVTLYVDGMETETQKGEAVFRFQIPISGTHHIEAKAGAACDQMTVRRVAEKNKDYIFGKGGGITNWFDKDDFKPGYFSIRDTMGTLQTHPQAGVLVGQLMAKATAARGDVAESVKDNPGLLRMMAGMTLESLLKQAGDAVTKEQVQMLNTALQQIKK